MVKKKLMKLFYILIVVFTCIFSEKIQAQSQQLDKKANVGKWDKFKKPIPKIPFSNPSWINEDVKIIGATDQLNQYYKILSGLKNLPAKHTWPNGSHYVRDGNLIFVISADTSMCCVLKAERPPVVESIYFFFDPKSKLVMKYITLNGDFSDLTIDKAILFINDQLYGQRESD